MGPLRPTHPKVDRQVIGSREIFRTLNSFDVEYVAIGGMAIALQGLVLKTDDVDICPASSSENLTRLVAALVELEAKEWDPHRGEVVDHDWSPDLLSSDSLWILRTKHGALDLLFNPLGTDGYGSLSQDADVMKAGRVEVPVASLNSIIDMKEASPRPKDREQLVYLYRLRKIRQREMLELEGSEPDISLDEIRPRIKPEE